MKKLRLDLNNLRIHSFVTDSGMAVGAAPTQYESFCTSGCTRQCAAGTIYGADPGTVLTGGLLGTCARGRVEAWSDSGATGCTACEDRYNHTTA